GQAGVVRPAVVEHGEVGREVGRPAVEVEVHRRPGGNRELGGRGRRQGAVRGRQRVVAGGVNDEVGEGGDAAQGGRGGGGPAAGERAAVERQRDGRALAGERVAVLVPDGHGDGRRQRHPGLAVGRLLGENEARRGGAADRRHPGATLDVAGGVRD